MLDEFSSAKLDDKQPAPSSSIPAAAVAEGAPTDEESDFANQLQAGMAELLGEMDSNPDMRKQFEQMMQELGAATAADGGPALPQDLSSPAPPAPPGLAQPKASAGKKTADESFQDTIRKTMERMQNSGETASAAAAASSDEDMLAKMLKEMESGNFPGMDGQGGEEDFNKMLLGMMEQLTNKEILYEPMKELYDKFPNWLQANKDSVTKDDLRRYELQQSLVTEIVGRFERKGYSDDNAGDRDYIIERMQKACRPRTGVFEHDTNTLCRCKQLAHHLRTL